MEKCWLFLFSRSVWGGFKERRGNGWIRFVWCVSIRMFWDFPSGLPCLRGLRCLERSEGIRPFVNFKINPTFRRSQIKQKIFEAITEKRWKYIYNLWKSDQFICIIFRNDLITPMLIDFPLWFGTVKIILRSSWCRISCDHFACFSKTKPSLSSFFVKSL